MKQAERMRLAGKQQVLLWLSAEAKSRLERLAAARGSTQVAVIESALALMESGAGTGPDLFASGPAVPGSGDTDHDLLIETAARVNLLEKQMVNRFDLDYLASKVSSNHSFLSDDLSELRGALASIRMRLLALENGGKTVPAGAVGADMAQPIPEPHLEPNGAEMPDSVALAAPESRPAEDSADITADRSEELAALIASIPKADFVAGGNERRNRRLLELHLEGLGISQISKELRKENIPNSGDASVQHFLKKHGIKPNQVGRWPEKK